MEFHAKFPDLERMIVTDRHLNLHGEIMRNRWTEEQWKRKLKVYQNDWGRDWKAVESFFEGKGILITRSSDEPETDKDKKIYIASYPTCPSLGNPVLTSHTSSNQDTCDGGGSGRSNEQGARG